MASEPTQQTIQNCSELAGLIAMFMEDATNNNDKIAIGNALLIAAISTYRKAKFTFNDIDQILAGAVTKYREARDKL